MKTYKIVGSVIVLLSLFTLNNCSDKSTLEYKSTETVSISLSLENIRSGFAVETAKNMEKPGNIYVYGNYLFINELHDGLHIIDNSNPSNPLSIAYLRIPGNSDLVIRNNFMYANSGPDLVVLDISNPAKVQFVKRILSAFFESGKLNNGAYIIGQGEKEVTVKRNITRGWDYVFYNYVEEPAILSSSNNNDGIGGSMARIVLADNYLYFVNSSNIIPIDLTIPDAPAVKTSVALGRGTIETLFKYKEYLFVGSMNGVFILDYKTNPAVPSILSTVQHIRSCDPVVVQEDVAFSTLSNGAPCGGGINELMVLDVKNAAKPTIIAEYFMETTPLGLGVLGNNLFVCQGENGFAWYKTDNLKEIINNKVSEDVNIHARDVIIIGNNLLVTGENGVTQYTYDMASGSMTRVSTLFTK
jgi:hypothetical protein